MNYIHAHWSLPCFPGHGIANQVNVTTATVIRLTPHDPACHLGLPLLRRPCRVAVTTTAAAPRSAARFDDLPPKRKKQQYVKPKPKPEPVVQQTRLAKVHVVISLPYDSAHPFHANCSYSTPCHCTTVPTPLRMPLQALAAAGVASRRACEDLIAAGQVAVNGQVVSAQGSMIDPARDRVQVAGKAVDVRVKPVYYFALYKPPGYVCSQASRPGYEGLRAVDLLQPWLDEWSKKNERLVRAGGGGGGGVLACVQYMLRATHAHHDVGLLKHSSMDAGHVLAEVVQCVLLVGHMAEALACTTCRASCPHGSTQ
jgi:hypothetical protein